MRGRFIAVVGPSGVGKDSVMKELALREPRFTLARRVITRTSDTGGEDFDAVTLEEFARREAAGDFILSWRAHGLHYAIPKTVQELVEGKQDVLANVSRTVLSMANEHFERFEVVNLGADIAVLAQRLAHRGRETEKQIAARLERVAPSLPPNIQTWNIDNSGTVDQTSQAVMARLYPIKEP